MFDIIIICVVPVINIYFTIDLEDDCKKECVDKYEDWDKDEGQNIPKFSAF